MHLSPLAACCSLAGAGVNYLHLEISAKRRGAGREMHALSLLKKLVTAYVIYAVQNELLLASTPPRHYFKRILPNTLWPGSLQSANLHGDVCIISIVYSFPSISTRFRRRMQFFPLGSEIWEGNKEIQGKSKLATVL